MSEQLPEQPGASLHALDGGKDRPSGAPAWAPSSATLDYLNKLATVAFLAFGLLYFLGAREFKPFADKHVAAV